MVQNMTEAGRKARHRANKQAFLSGDIESNTLIDGVYVPVFEVQADRTTTYAAGYGSDNRNQGRVGWADLDIQNGGSSASDGNLRWEVYRDSSKEDLVYKSDTFRSEQLRSAVASDRTEKEVMPQYANVPPEDGYLVLAMDADSGSDGDTLSASNSSHDVGIPYSRIQ